MDKRVQIFISHISNEASIANAIKEHLSEDFLGMLEIFVSSDAESISGGSSWLQEVGIALRKADILLVLCSADSIGRPWVNFEAGAAWLRDIPVMPICHSGLHLNELPMPFSVLQAAEFSSPAGLEKLYGLIAKTLEINLPPTDLNRLSSQLGAVEHESIARNKIPKQVLHPKVLCAASERHAQYGFDSDIAVLEEHFPNSVTTENNLTVARLRELLANEKYDIIHLVLEVDHISGDLIFDRIAPVQREDRMKSQGFAALLEETNAKLVVLATCNALPLAADLAKVTNLAAGFRDLADWEVKEWGDCFYGFLADGLPLFKAFDLTSTQTEVPIKVVRRSDVAFTL